MTRCKDTNCSVFDSYLIFTPATKTTSRLSKEEPVCEFGDDVSVEILDPAPMVLLS